MTITLDAKIIFQQAVNEFILADYERITLLQVFNQNNLLRAEAAYERAVKSRAELEQAARTFANIQYPGKKEAGFKFLMVDAEKQRTVNAFTRGAAMKEDIDRIFQEWATAKKDIE